MHHFTAHHLRLSLEIETSVELGAQQGSALRGMLFHALRGPERNPALGFCVQRHLKTCADCSLVAACPVAGLVSTLNPEGERGRDVPRMACELRKAAKDSGRRARGSSGPPILPRRSQPDQTPARHRLVLARPASRCR